MSKGSNKVLSTTYENLFRALYSALVTHTSLSSYALILDSNRSPFRRTRPLSEVVDRGGPIPIPEIVIHWMLTPKESGPITNS